MNDMKGNRKKQGESCCVPDDGGFKVESIVSVDERGQMVLPKEVRQKAGIKPGDKLAVVSLKRGGKVCCISLIKTEELALLVNGILGPLADELKK